MPGPHVHPALRGFEKYAPRFNSKSRGSMDAALGMSILAQLGQGQGVMPSLTTDAAVAGGLAFLSGELERLDPKVREPLTNQTWMRDVPVKTGGGYIDFTSNFNLDFGISGPNNYGIQANQTTQIPMIQANITKDIYRVFNWANTSKTTFFDLQKLQTAGRSIEDLLDRGIRLNWNLAVNATAYTGPAPGYPGLLNNANVAAQSAALNAAGTSRKWSAKSSIEILNDVNSLMLSTWAAGQYSIDSMANQILVPPAQWVLLLQPLTVNGGVGGTSLLKYLEDNNLGRAMGIDLKIFMARQCYGAGAGGTDRMFGYVNDEDKVQLDIPVPAGRVMTQPSVEQGGCYLSLYAGQIGVVKFLYLQPAVYVDGI